MVHGIFDLDCSMQDLQWQQVKSLAVVCAISVPQPGSNLGPCIGNVESLPLAHQESPRKGFLCEEGEGELDLDLQEIQGTKRSSQASG